jgi:hypothetical protein
MRFHGWGITNTFLIESLPWFSVDSSGLASALRFGSGSLYDPDARRRVAYKTDGHDAYRHATLLRKHYGCAPEAIATRHPSTRQAQARVSVKSLQHIERALRRKFDVPPPSYGVAGTDAGPHIHGVMAPGGNNSIGLLCSERDAKYPNPPGAKAAA